MPIGTISSSFRVFAATTTIAKVESQLTASRQRLLSGERASQVSDDPEVYFSSERLTKRSQDFDQKVENSVEKGIRTIQTALEGLESIKSIVGHMEGLVKGMTNESDTKYVAKMFDELILQVNELAGDAGYEGQNLIVRDPNLVSPFCNKGEHFDVQFNPEDTNTFAINGQYAGASYVLADLFNPTTAFAVNSEHDAIRAYTIDESFLDVTYQDVTDGGIGNLQDVKLKFRINNFGADANVHSDGDVNGDGFTGSGEGFEADFVLDNSTGTVDSTGISFTNASIVSNPAFGFLFNTAANLGNAAAGTSTTTDTGSDLDVNIPNNVPDGTEFFITMDFTADGETTTGATFGPITVGQITQGLEVSLNQQTTTPKVVDSFTISHDCRDVVSKPADNKYGQWHYTERVSVVGADYSKDMVYLDFNDLNEDHQQILQAATRRDGIGVMDSWLYQNFETAEGRAGAVMHIEEAYDRIDQMERKFQTMLSVLTSRSGFTDEISFVHQGGSDKLQSINLAKEEAEFKALETRLLVGHDSLQSVTSSESEAASRLAALL